MITLCSVKLLKLGRSNTRLTLSELWSDLRGDSNSTHNNAFV